MGINRFKQITEECKQIQMNGLLKWNQRNTNEMVGNVTFESLKL